MAKEEGKIRIKRVDEFGKGRMKIKERGGKGSNAKELSVPICKPFIDILLQTSTRKPFINPLFLIFPPACFS